MIPLRLAVAIVTTVIGVLALRPEPLPAFSTGPYPAAITLTLTAGFAVGFGFLFNRPSKVAAFGPDATGRVLRTGYVLGLGILGWFIARQPGLVSWFEPGFEPLSLIPLVTVVAVSLDVIAEARAVRCHGELVSVWPEQRLYAVEGARHALDRSGIPSLARSVHQRVLWHFLAPFIPIQIMVPKERAEEAGQLLLEYFRAAAAAREASKEAGP